MNNIIDDLFIKERDKNFSKPKKEETSDMDTIGNQKNSESLFLDVLKNYKINVIKCN